MQDNYGPLYLFPPLIWKYQYNFDWKILKPKVDRLFNLVEENSKLEEGNAWSTVSLPSCEQPHTWEELAHFQQWLGGIIANIRIQNNFIIHYSEVTQSWVNKHGPAGRTLEHNHNYTTFVVASYLYCPENSGNIVFRDPLEYHKASFPIFPEESGFKEVPVTTNDVVIFPGWLKHHVQPNHSNEDRYVLTINIK